MRLCGLQTEYHPRDTRLWVYIKETTKNDGRTLPQSQQIRHAWGWHESSILTNHCGIPSSTWRKASTIVPTKVSSGKGAGEPNGAEIPKSKIAKASQHSSSQSLCSVTTNYCLWCKVWMASTGQTPCGGRQAKKIEIAFTSTIKTRATRLKSVITSITKLNGWFGPACSTNIFMVRQTLLMLSKQPLELAPNPSR